MTWHDMGDKWFYGSLLRTLLKAPDDREGREKTSTTIHMLRLILSQSFVLDDKILARSRRRLKMCHDPVQQLSPARVGCLHLLCRVVG